ncbi:hypothetical protein CLIM01_15066 [Colletotrichum limetticola]|uniref:Uncharacterized protein n=1 Tax=Colletotrichum limetticola TaxID=1209924 RepID=A0ABQ9PAZ7_9PEZI|nr:hypothetical protein CLIM01_15066 [Colletotrichum limetticola]
MIRQFSRSQEPGIAVRRRGGPDNNARPSIEIERDADLVLNHLVILVLKDTECIYPKISQTESESHLNGISNRFGKILKRKSSQVIL